MKKGAPRGRVDRPRRELGENLRLVDVVVELRDARIPQASAGRGIEELVSRKPRLVVLNKADLAAPDLTREWLDWFRGQGVPAVAVSVLDGWGMEALAAGVRRLAADRLARLRKAGLRGRRVRAMVVGIPNVGKSSLINRCVGVARARTGDFPGITRGKQWVRAGDEFDLLDTPGVVPARLDAPDDLFRLAVTGALRPGTYEAGEVARRLLRWMAETDPRGLASLGVNLRPEPGCREMLEEFGRVRGCLGPGGVVDVERAAARLIREFQKGALGRVTLERPGPCAAGGQPVGHREF